MSCYSGLQTWVIRRPGFCLCCNQEEGSRGGLNGLPWGWYSAFLSRKMDQVPGSRFQVPGSRSRPCVFRNEVLPAPSLLRVTTGFYPVAELSITFLSLRKDSPLRVGFSPCCKAELHLLACGDRRYWGGVGGVDGLLGDSPAGSCE